MLSKHFSMSASNIQQSIFSIFWIISFIACGQPLSGLKPYEFLSAVFSYHGSIASFTIICFTLSLIVGIPNGLFSGLPGFGIHTLLIGSLSSVSFKLFSHVFISVPDFSSYSTTPPYIIFLLYSMSWAVFPSIPAVFLPLFSLHTLLKASIFSHMLLRPSFIDLFISIFDDFIVAWPNVSFQYLYFSLAALQFIFSHPIGPINFLFQLVFSFGSLSSFLFLCHFVICTTLTCRNLFHFRDFSLPIL